MSAELSYVHGASAAPLIGETVGAQFDHVARRWGDRPALVVREQGVRWSYADLQREVDAFATGLLALGLNTGDRVGIWSPNSAERLVTQLATAKAGLILVNINPAYRTHELEYALNQVGCRALDALYGIGPVTAVAIWAELGDAGRFSSARFAVRHAGLEPRELERAALVFGTGTGGAGITEQYFRRWVKEEQPPASMR